MRKLEYLELVKIKTDRTDKRDINGLNGVILGASKKDDEVIYDYQVHVFEKKLSHGLYPDELESTGKFMKYEDFYDGTTMSVKVDKEGSGEVVSYNESE